MIGVILAAGVGSRLRPMTNDKPKCLVKTANKEILQYQLDSYIEAGIKELYLIVGYEGDTIREYCKHIKDINIHIVENDIYEDSNNMYSLYLAKQYIKGKNFILNNADLSISSGLVSLLVNDKRKDLIAVDHSLFNDESMKVSINEDGFINDISKQVTESNSIGCSIDFYKFSAESSNEFFNKIEEIIEKDKNLKDWTEVAMQKLFQSQMLKFIPLDIKDTLWVEIDNYDDLALSDKIFSQQKKKIIDYKHFCLDLDGTVYVGKEVIPNIVSTIEYIKSIGKTVNYLSNNSSKNKVDYASKLNSLGLSCNPNDVVLSTDSSIEYLKHLEVKKIFVLGTKSLEDVVIGEGFEICTSSPEFVLVGYDTELTYDKLVTVCGLINKGVDYIATHCDLICPSEQGAIPDIGTIINMLTTTTGKKPYKVFGKPEVELINDICKNKGLAKSDVLMIGDRLYTDIKMAVNASIDSLLVLSGDTSRDELENSNILPTYVLKDFSEIL